MLTSSPPTPTRLLRSLRRVLTTVLGPHRTMPTLRSSSKMSSLAK